MTDETKVVDGVYEVEEDTVQVTLDQLSYNLSHLIGNLCILVDISPHDLQDVNHLIGLVAAKLGLPDPLDNTVITEKEALEQHEESQLELNLEK